MWQLNTIKWFHEIIHCFFLETMYLKREKGKLHYFSNENQRQPIKNVENLDESNQKLAYDAL